MGNHLHIGGKGAPVGRAWLAHSRAARALFAVLLLVGAVGARAESIYQCVHASGPVAYRDTPCSADALQRKIDLQPLAKIGNAAEVAASGRRRGRTHERRTSRGRRRTQSRHRAKPVMSWECRAADGEVFYRHTRCPGSVPGDGVVRTRYAETLRASHPRKRRDAWSRVPVHGVKIPRAEACRRIRSAGAAIRDGHQRDAHVSTYDRLMGRGPCAGT